LLHRGIDLISGFSTPRSRKGFLSQIIAIKDAGAKAFVLSQFANANIAAFIKQEAEAT
jgi:hypothetical protein